MTVAKIIADALAVPTRNDKALFSAVRALGLTISKQDGEYRISRPNLTRERAEAIAYYTNDRFDAWGTAEEMARDAGILDAKPEAKI
ncbi:MULTISPECIES: hypothetical protein [Hyphomicrobiales]|uniref:hypothetical protein n=1 Tax=Hyphomicrobiales TaxID=356 RepID=UPI000F662F71|nr:MULTISPECIES: hypothetical protein [Hyphomicrobiales]MCQ9147323.1 hypothetical protein [Ochrobactrum sp. BTU2]MDH1271547.1 hypothetical protein [Agrobacterium pusense]MDX4076706.1 hypothetical protein [Brucella sp. NBRC 113783]RSC24714.1 hypothetical protein EGT36_28205 [Agrobacterium sp. FDAARGOS_525]